MASSSILLLGLLALLVAVSASPVPTGDSSEEDSHEKAHPKVVAVLADPLVPNPIVVANAGPSDVTVKDERAVIVPDYYYPYWNTRGYQISHGVNTIVGGAATGNLEQILRGAFSIPGSYHVRGTAHGVLDSIFGRRYYY